MPWLIVVLGYLLGSIPTAYIAGRLLKGRDIRQMGDGNMGAANAFYQLGAGIGIAVGIVDTAKGVLATLIAQAVNMPHLVVLATGMTAVIGHNWPIFLGFRGGRGVCTTIGVLLTIIPQPMLILAGPATLTLLLSRSTTLASVFLFMPLPLVGWWLKLSGVLIIYSMILPCLVGFTHFLRTRQATNASRTEST